MYDWREERVTTVHKTLHTHVRGGPVARNSFPQRDHLQHGKPSKSQDRNSSPFTPFHMHMYTHIHTHNTHTTHTQTHTHTHTHTHKHTHTNTHTHTHTHTTHTHARAHTPTTHHILWDERCQYSLRVECAGGMLIMHNYIAPGVDSHNCVDQHNASNPLKCPFASCIEVCGLHITIRD